MLPPSSAEDYVINNEERQARNSVISFAIANETKSLTLTAVSVAS
jgi:hypothetical protein